MASSGRTAQGTQAGPEAPGEAGGLIIQQKPGKKKRATGRKRDPEGSSGQPLDKTELELREEARTNMIQTVFADLQLQMDSLGGASSAVVDRWIADATLVVDDFRESKDLFPADRVGLRLSASEAGTNYHHYSGHLRGS